MLFADYADLRMTVLDTIKRNDVDLELRRFVIMAEEHLNSKIRHPDMIGSPVTITMANGVGTLPADFLEFESVYNAAGVRLIQSSKDAGMAERNLNGYFYVQANSIVVGGSFTGPVSADYYSKLPTLTTAATNTNWLLQKYPRAYLYATCFEAMDFLGDEKAAKYEGQRDVLIRTVNIEGERRRFGNAEVSLGYAP